MRKPITRGSSSAVVTTAWTILAAIALLWPARVTGTLDGAPLDGVAEALLIGLVVPALWWLAPAFLATPSARVTIAALLVWKAVTTVTFVPHGLCARTTADRPLDGIIQQIAIVEPSGVLRSWDVRADWRSNQPRCTAIITRPLVSQDRFPAWYLNLTDHLLGRRDVEMSLSGVVTIAEPRTLSIVTDERMKITGTVGGQQVAPEGVRLSPGSHELSFTLNLTGERWRFEPLLDGALLWERALVTQATPGALDRLAAPARLLTAALVLVLVALWMVHAWRALQVPASMSVAIVLLTTASVIIGAQPAGLLHRLAGGLGVAALFTAVPAHLRNLRGAFLLVGVPWLAFFATFAADRIGVWNAYSADDWLTYQVAGYRIFMHGYWLEGGSAAFDYQPLYRWMTGALHLIFGDSSVGEVYWDATCLLTGAMLAFYVVKVRAGFYWGIAALTGTLLTFTVGTPWYFLGRGLSEIAAAGWAFLAIFFMLRARKGHWRAVAAAAACAILMFYTRLNHLLYAGFLVAFLLPLRTSCEPSAIVAALRVVSRRRAVIYLSVFAAGVLLFMSRTWLYTGVFSLFFGTSLRHNDTGLRPWTLFDPEVWSKVAHSIAGLVFLNEPPSPDPRAILVITGAIVAAAALLQVPLARRQSAALVVASIGASVGSLLAHTHNYPGRLSIHFVPLAVALTVGLAGSVMPWRRRVGLTAAVVGPDAASFSKQRRAIYAAIASGLSVTVTLTALLGVDIYLHSRYERSAGFNLWGYRGAAIGDKQPGEYRAVVLGGSSAYGYGVSWEQAMPAQLEQRLAAEDNRFRVVNLGYNNEGAYSFRFTLEDYLYLNYDLAILYEGYNDLMGDPRAPNLSVFRRDSPVFRLTGYLPIFPMVFKEKAAALVSGGDSGALYSSDRRTVFRPSLATRTAAGALTAAAEVGQSLERQLGRVISAPPRSIVNAAATGCAYPWQEYCRSILEAVRFALAHGKQAMLVTQPYAPGEYLRARHMQQQSEAAGLLQRAFGNDPRVLYVNLGNTVDLADPALSFDRMHLTAAGNAAIASMLVEPVREMRRRSMTQ